MRILSRIDVTVELLSTKVEVGELAKAATWFGANVTIGPDPDPNKDRVMRAEVRQQTADWATENLWRLVYLQALCDGTTADEVLAGVRRDLERMHVPVDRTPFDAPGLGEASS